jgi:hypothetical protein
MKKTGLRENLRGTHDRRYFRGPLLPAVKRGKTGQLIQYHRRAIFRLTVRCTFPAADPGTRAYRI